MYKKFILLFSLIFLNSCNIPSPSDKNIKKDYFTGGGIRSEFIMSNQKTKTGVLKKYGYKGKVTSIAHIRNGVRHGEEVGYDEGGRVLWRYFFVNGKEEGLQKAFYPNGDVMISYTYKDGIKNGEAKSYRQDGSIVKKVIYNKGKLVR